MGTSGNKWEQWASKGGLLGPLRRKVKRQKAERRIYFWLDTLCIPTGDETDNPRVKELRMKAIKHITPIFNGTQVVLVLDSELARLGPEHYDDHGRVHNEVLAARVLATKWMQRAWTLEEGSLAKKCYFVVGNTLQVLRPNSEIIDPLGRRIIDSLTSTRTRWKTRHLSTMRLHGSRTAFPALWKIFLARDAKWLTGCRVEGGKNN